MLSHFPKDFEVILIKLKKFESLDYAPENQLLILMVRIKRAAFYYEQKKTQHFTKLLKTRY